MLTNTGDAHAPLRWMVGMQHQVVQVGVCLGAKVPHRLLTYSRYHIGISLVVDDVGNAIVGELLHPRVIFPEPNKYHSASRCREIEALLVTCASALVYRAHPTTFHMLACHHDFTTCCG